MKIKKKIIIYFVITAIVVCLATVISIYSYSNHKANEEYLTSDSYKFKTEYEALNGKPNKDGTKKYTNITIDKNDKIQYYTENDAIDLIEEGTGIMYFGFPTCPWCRAAVPVFLEVAREYDVQINYLNVNDIRDKLVIDEDGSIKVESQGTPGYYQLLEELNDVLKDYTLKDEGGKDIKTGEKRIYAPSFVFVKNGEIVGFHSATVESQEDPYMALTNEQKSELTQIFKTNIEKVVK